MTSRQCLGMGTLVLALLSSVAQAAPLEDGLAAYKAGNYKRALALWRPLAEKGNATAQYNLGALYTNGQGVAKDHAKAFYWYHRSSTAKQAFKPAILQVAIAYYRGQGVTKNYSKALRWAREAKQRGVKQAEAWLNRAYTDLFPKPLPGWTAGKVTSRHDPISLFIGNIVVIEIDRTYKSQTTQTKLGMVMSANDVNIRTLLAVVYADPKTADDRAQIAQLKRELKKAGMSLRRVSYPKHKAINKAIIVHDVGKRERAVVLEMTSGTVVGFTVSPSTGPADIDVVNAYLQRTQLERIGKTLDEISMETWGWMDK